MSSINDCSTVHEFLEVYFKNGTAEEKKSAAPLAEKIKAQVEGVFKKNQGSEQFALCIKDAAFPPMGRRHITKVVGLAIKELHPECEYTLDDNGAFLLRGGAFIELSCQFTITYKKN